MIQFQKPVELIQFSSIITTCY